MTFISSYFNAFSFLLMVQKDPVDDYTIISENHPFHEFSIEVTFQNAIYK